MKIDIRYIFNVILFSTAFAVIFTFLFVSSRTGDEVVDYANIASDEVIAEYSVDPCVKERMIGWLNVGSVLRESDLKDFKRYCENTDIVKKQLNVITK